MAASMILLGISGALAGCAGGLRPSGIAARALSPPRTPGSSKEDAIGVLKEGWHTGLVLPVTGIAPSLPGLRQWFPHATYLAFGWGNRAFYMAAHRGLGTALAALLPSRSVMFIHGLPNAPEKALPPNSPLRWVCVSANEASKLDRYLRYYLQRGPNGQLIRIESGPFPDSQFFASTGAYDAFHTCNTWTMEGLAFAGLPVSAEGVVFSGQVMHRISALRACRKPSTPSGTDLARNTVG